MLTIDTPLGVLRASESDYYDHPGIWIELQRPGEDGFSPLVLVEYTDGEEDKLNAETIITRVWKDPEGEAFVQTVHENIIAPEESG